MLMMVHSPALSDVRWQSSDPRAGITDGSYRLGNELQTTLVDVWWQDGNPHPSALADENRYFFRVIDFVAQ